MTSFKDFPAADNTLPEKEYTLEIYLKSGNILRNAITHRYSADDIAAVLWTMVKTSKSLNQPVSVTGGKVPLMFDPHSVEAITVTPSN